MKKLKHDKVKKEYRGVAMMAEPYGLDAQIMVIAPSHAVLKKFAYTHWATEFYPKLCKKAKVVEDK
jgi:hypothetical protein